MDLLRSPINTPHARACAMFARRHAGWDVQRFSVMLLPVIPAAILASLFTFMESGTPGPKVRIETAAYFEPAPSDVPEPSRQFRTVYTQRDSRAIEIANLLQALGPHFDESIQRSLGALLVRLGEHYGYDPVLILAVIMTESSFDPHSRSEKGALGLMQIRPATGESLMVETRRRWWGAHTLFDPYLNISLGVRYLAKLQKRFGSLDVALTAYNYGPSRIDEFIRRGEPLPTAYARRVLDHYQQLRLLQSTAAL